MVAITTMDYEKNYKEALKVITDNLNALNEITKTGAEVVNIQTIKNCFYKAFPELRESDKWTPKEIINYLKEKGDYRSCWITWLEKQGEQKDIINNQSDFVDLGLPSGTLWAKCNLGAEKETDFGLYYQWGDTQGYEGTSECRNWNGYKYGSFKKLIKYNDLDDKMILDNEDDPVFVATNGRFKMPTTVQLQELIDNTNHKWTSIDGVNGIEFTNKKDDTKYIFIPAAGFCDNIRCGVGSWGYVWSASCCESGDYNAWSMTFDAGDVLMYNYNRCDGFSVRGVINS